MAEIRTGLFGEYYGCQYTESHALTKGEMEINAQYIYSYLSANGWTVEAIAGILGNMQHESSINPGRWQSDNVGAMNSGYSLVQWTPAKNYIEWCGSKDPSKMDVALSRIMYELENNQQYYATPSYNLTFREFTQSTDSPYTLACAFAWNYERSYVVLYGTEAEQEALRQKRGGAANEWYAYLTGVTPTPPTPPDNPENKKKQLSLLLMWQATRRR